MFFPACRHVLQHLLDKIAQEEKELGMPSKKTLLCLAEYLVRFAPNYYTNPGTPYYSDEEKQAAKALLCKYGLKAFVNLSPRYKKSILQLIRQERAKEA